MYTDCAFYELINCFCGMVDWRKAFNLISSRDHCQRSSPSRISDSSRAGFESVFFQNLQFGIYVRKCTTKFWDTVPNSRVSQYMGISFDKLLDKHHQLNWRFLSRVKTKMIAIIYITLIIPCFYSHCQTSTVFICLNIWFFQVKVHIYSSPGRFSSETITASTIIEHLNDWY